jgi:DNA topoisomerase-1
MKGPYGFYVQLGPTPEDKTIKPKRAAWPKNIPVASADLDTALKMLALPRKLGDHPESGKIVEANIGRFGPYVKHDGMFKSIPKAESVHNITLTRAVELLAEKKAAGGGGRSLGAHPEDKRNVAVHSGRYGPYVKYGKVNATIPASIDPEKITLDEALELLSARAAKSGKPVKAGKAKTAKPKPVKKSAKPEEPVKLAKAAKTKAKKKPAAKGGRRKAA